MPLPLYLVEGASLRYTSAHRWASAIPRQESYAVTTGQPEGFGVRLCVGFCLGVFGPGCERAGRAASAPGAASCCGRAEPTPGLLSLQGLISAVPAPLIPHCQLWQFLLGERVSSIPQKCALQGREIPEQNRKAAASLLHLALYPASPSSCCRGR